MQIGGIQHFSLIDFPGKLAAVVFTPGCNFRCPFCHNVELVQGTLPGIPEDDVLQFLSKRSGQLEGVVISGGEPTLQKDLPEFIKKIRELGYKIKLDTNGAFPEILKQLIDEQLLDFVAMDIKHAWGKYPIATSIKNVAIEKIKQSIDLLLSNIVDYEFRTTVIRDFHQPEDLIEIAKQIQGAKRYVVQEFIPEKTLDERFHEKLPFERKTLEELSLAMERYVQHFEIRQ